MQQKSRAVGARHVAVRGLVLGWSIDPRTRDWEDDDRQVTSRRFILHVD